MHGNWSFPTSIRFGAGRLEELPEACVSAGIHRPLFVTDRGLKDLDITERALGILERNGFGRAVFADVDQNPTDLNLEDGLRIYRDGDFDGVVAFGGGSGLDLGKMIAFMSGQSRPVWDFEDIGDWWKRADDDGIDPSVAVPTTAGTGSEVGRASVITNSRDHVKKIIFHPKVLPSAVISDPELTVGLPKPVTAGTGMDAFIHCLEAYCSPNYHPMCAGIALEGMRLVLDNLPSAYHDGSDIEARANMMSAASMGAVAFQKGLGAIHALSHPASALYGTHHGLTNAVIMPCVLEFNRAAIEPRIEAVATYCGIEHGFDGYLAHICSLMRSIGVPEQLSDLGVDLARINLMAEMAVEDPSMASNPVKLSVDNAIELYERCIAPT